MFMLKIILTYFLYKLKHVCVVYFHIMSYDPGQLTSLYTSLPFKRTVAHTVQKPKRGNLIWACLICMGHIL